jgi:hypothetical protein
MFRVERFDDRRARGQAGTDSSMLSSVMRCAGVLIVAALGCGRVGFERGAPSDATPDTPVDAVPLPESICQLERQVIEAVGASAELVVAPTADGYAAAWSGGASMRMATFGTDHKLRAQIVLSEVTQPHLAGLVDAGTAFVLATASDIDAGTGTEKTWILPHDLSALAPGVAQTVSTPGRDPFPSENDHRRRAYVTGDGNNLVMRYVSASGTIGASREQEVGAPVVGLSCTDGPSTGTPHAHCVWQRTLTNGSAECRIGDVVLNAEESPSLRPEPEIFFPDCHAPRITGAAPPDMDEFVVWASETDGSIMAATVPVFKPFQLFGGGSAPQVRFDGTRFWIAWIDRAGALQLGTYEPVTETMTRHPVTGWTPSGPDAFALVRRDDKMTLSVLSGTHLDVLTVCAE